MIVNKYRREIASAMKCGKTVRRRHNEDYRRRAFKRRWWHDFDATYGEYDVQREYDQEAREVFHEGRCITRTPNRFHHVEVTVPERRKASVQCRQVCRLIDLEDAPVFPDGRRTQIGYW